MRKKVLLVDDTETVIMMEKLIMGSLGVEITVARNGQEALNRVGVTLPDLILLDIQMPILDGIELCRRLKSSANTKDIPIIMVTTRGDPEKVEQAFLAGCNDYVTKPIDKLELLAKAKRYLG